jgi:hypothetical protein
LLSGSQAVMSVYIIREEEIKTQAIYHHTLPSRLPLS